MLQRTTGRRALAWGLALACVILGRGEAPAFPSPWRHGKPVAPSPAPAEPAAAAGASSVISSGRLANGLAYAIQPIAGAPVSVRLRLAGTGVQTEPDAAALAEVLRRLAFDATKTRRGDPRKLAAAKGLAFSHDQTAEPVGLAGAAYRLDEVKGDPASLAAALDLLRGVADGLRLEQKDIDRARDAAAAAGRGAGAIQRRIYLARAAFLLGLDPVAATGEPPARIRRANLTRFYAAAYRPDEAVLTVAGEVEPGRLQQQIAEVFGDWRARGAPASPPAAEASGARAAILVDAAAPGAVQLTWLAASPATAGSAASPASPARPVAIALVNNRLAAIDAGAALIADPEAPAGAVSLLAGAQPGRWRESLAALDAAARRAAEAPVQAGDFAQAIGAERARLAERAEAGAPSSAEAADSLVEDLAAGRTPATTSEQRARFDANFAALTPEAVRRAAGELFGGAGPAIFVTAAEPIAGGEAAVLQAYQQAHAAPLSAASPPAPLAWPYADLGPPGAIASQSEVADLGAVFVAFENGARLIVKPTKFKPGEVRVKLLAGAGLPANLDGPAVVRAGLKKIAFADIAATLPGARLSVALAAEDGAAAFTGVTTSEDLETQLQVLAAYLLDPAHPPPSAPGESAGPIEAVIVGDVTAEKAIAAAAPTLGALPAAPGRPPPAPPEPSSAEALLAQIAVNRGDARAPSAGEVEAARAVLLARVDRDERSNAWWLAGLPYVDLDPARLARLRSRRAALLRATPEEVRAVARR